MIEYMYSRIIASIASIALVAVVASAALGASDLASQRCAEQVAASISSLVATAFETNADSFEQRLAIDAGASSSDLSISINGSFVEVEKGRHSATCSFQWPVRLLADGMNVSSIAVMPGSMLKVKAYRGLFEKQNRVTIEVVADPPLSDHPADGCDEPVDIPAVVIDVERGAGRAVRHPPVLEPGVRAVHS